MPLTVEVSNINWNPAGNSVQHLNSDVQCFHPLLQSMYSALSDLLDGNPFSESGQLQVPDGLSTILEVLKEALKLLNTFQVHPDISLQLCAYLFFFINASLFNSLMERGKVSAQSFDSLCCINKNVDYLIVVRSGLSLVFIMEEFVFSATMNGRS